MRAGDWYATIRFRAIRICSKSCSSLVGFWGILRIPASAFTEVLSPRTTVWQYWHLPIISGFGVEFAILLTLLFDPFVDHGLLKPPAVSKLKRRHKPLCRV